MLLIFYIKSATKNSLQIATVYSYLIYILIQILNLYLLVCNSYNIYIKRPHGDVTENIATDLYDLSLNASGGQKTYSSFHVRVDIH